MIEKTPRGSNHWKLQTTTANQDDTSRSKNTPTSTPADQTLKCLHSDFSGGRTRKHPKHLSKDTPNNYSKSKRDQQIKKWWMRSNAEVFALRL